MARILIANDSHDLLDLCRSILEEDGHLVKAVTGGKEAVRVARDWQPDLILIDWVMPEMDGPTAIRILRGDPTTSSLPILLMSGTQDGDAAANSGADSFLPKPFLLEELLGRVEELLRDAAAGNHGKSVGATER
jgi:DNA-binding response OmpR family regulator